MFTIAETDTTKVAGTTISHKTVITVRLPVQVPPRALRAAIQDLNMDIKVIADVLRGVEEDVLILIAAEVVAPALLLHLVPVLPRQVVLRQAVRQVVIIAQVVLLRLPVALRLPRVPRLRLPPRPVVPAQVPLLTLEENLGILEVIDRAQVVRVMQVTVMVAPVTKKRNVHDDQVILHRIVLPVLPVLLAQAQAQVQVQVLVLVQALALALVLVLVQAQVLAVLLAALAAQVKHEQGKENNNMRFIL